MSGKLTKLMEWLRQERIDAAFITSPDNVFYITGFRCEPHERLLALIVFQEKEPILVCPGMETEEARRAGWNEEIIGYSDTDNPWDLIQKRMSARLDKIRLWAIEKDHLNITKFEQLRKLYQDASFLPAEPFLNELRLIKDSKEIELLEQACELVDFAVKVGVNEIAEGRTEVDLIATIEYEITKKGAGMAFSPLVLAGANTASPHGVPGDTKIRKGDFVLFDLGVSFNGYCSDITRTIAFGEVSDEQKKIYETVLKAQETAVQLTKPGVPAKELDIAARNIISEAGYGHYFTHRLGHGLGIGVHEYPSVHERNDMPLKTGMVFTIEPGIYIPGFTGVRIEDDVLVTENGVRVMTTYPKTLQIVE
ncbi:Xaa-Pro peptidase family protein [Siminovitchia sp. FSL W7-1587]|uniref:M24 family metallopeptidase n=1 Tax=Siminovitchia sp. FSL W7-1587 TaxID=2954699 RepID=UPI0030D54725